MVVMHRTMPLIQRAHLQQGKQSAEDASVMTLDSKKKKKKAKTVVNSLVDTLYMNRLLLNINKYLVRKLLSCCLGCFGGVAMARQGLIADSEH